MTKISLQEKRTGSEPRKNERLQTVFQGDPSRASSENLEQTKSTSQNRIFRSSNWLISVSSTESGPEEVAGESGKPFVVVISGK